VTTLNESLYEEVQKLIRPFKDRQLLEQTMGTRAAIGVLDERLQVIEEALRELGLQVERLLQEKDHDPHT
jgi:cobalamin biosynthesis protein CbiG